MEFQIAGESNLLSLLLSYVFLSQLGIVFVLTSLVLSTTVAVVAFKKRIKKISSAFILPLISFLICGLCEYLALEVLRFQRLSGFMLIACRFIFGITLLVPYFVALSIVIKMNVANHEVEPTLKTPVESGEEQGSEAHP